MPSKLYFSLLVLAPCSKESAKRIMVCCKSVVKVRKSYSFCCVGKRKSTRRINVHISVIHERIGSLYSRKEYLEATTKKMRQVCHFMPSFSNLLNVKSDVVCIATTEL